jgi:hypothetical protein
MILLSQEASKEIKMLLNHSSKLFVLKGYIVTIVTPPNLGQRLLF